MQSNLFIVIWQTHSNWMFSQLMHFTGWRLNVRFISLQYCKGVCFVFGWLYHIWTTIYSYVFLIAISRIVVNSNVTAVPNPSFLFVPGHNIWNIWAYGLLTPATAIIWYLLFFMIWTYRAEIQDLENWSVPCDRIW